MKIEKKIRCLLEDTHVPKISIKEYIRKKFKIIIPASENFDTLVYTFIKKCEYDTNVAYFIAMSFFWDNSNPRAKELLLEYLAEKKVSLRANEPAIVNKIFHYDGHVNEIGEDLLLFKKTYLEKKKTKTKTSKKEKNETKKIPRENESIKHKELKKWWTDFGENLGYKVETEVPLDRYRIDVIFKTSIGKVPDVAIEIEHSSSIHKDLASLKHARDIWRCNKIILCLVEGNKTDIKKINDLLCGSFHEIKDKLDIVLEKDLPFTVSEINAFRKKYNYCLEK